MPWSPFLALVFLVVALFTTLLSDNVNGKKPGGKREDPNKVRVRRGDVL